MNARLQELIQVNSDDKQLIDSVIFNVVERCCEILQCESFKLDCDVFHELSFDEIVQKIRSEFYYV